MGLFKFTASTEQLSRDLLQIKQVTLAQTGDLDVGGQKMTGVLKISDSIFVTDKVVPVSVSQAMSLDRADLHQIKNHADMIQFLERVRAFDASKV